tara:strand:+ start:33 stop:893 length:861 start_codon:yes stop_codon:yes gene_type:complete
MQTLNNPHRTSIDFQKIAAGLHHLAERKNEPPDITEAASAAGLSPYHFELMFQNWAGMSLNELLAHSAPDAVSRRLRSSAHTINAAFAMESSNTKLLNNLFLNIDTVTELEHQTQGVGMIFSYGFHPSIFGEMILVKRGEELCGLGYISEKGRGAALTEQKSGWEQAQWQHDQKETESISEKISNQIKDCDARLPLLLRGTAFQTKVWKALLKVPRGAIISYADLARHIGQPLAARSVGAACGANRLGLLIPCHRVIRGNGKISGYRWGIERKQAILAYEAAMGAP